MAVRSGLCESCPVNLGGKENFDGSCYKREMTVLAVSLRTSLHMTRRDESSVSLTISYDLDLLLSLDLQLSGVVVFLTVSR